MIGHAWMVIPALIVYPFAWGVDHLDHRQAAQIRRRAKREGKSAVSLRDLQYYGDELGHHFQYTIDSDGVLSIVDLGVRCGFNGPRRTEIVFGVGHKVALVYDFRDDAKEWREIGTRSWMETAEETHSE